MKKILRFAKLPLYVSVLGCSPGNHDYSNELKKLNVDDQKLDNTDQSIEDRLRQLTQKSEQQEQVIASLQNLVRGKIDQSAMDAIVSRLPEGNIKDLISSLQTAQSTSVKQDDLTQLQSTVTSSQAEITQQLVELKQDLEGQLRQKADASGLAALSSRVDGLGSKPNGVSQEDVAQQFEALQKTINDLQTAQNTSAKQSDLTQLRADLAAITSSQPTTSQQLEELRQNLEKQIGEKANVSDFTTLSSKVDGLEGKLSGVSQEDVTQQFEELKQNLEGQLRQKADASGLAGLVSKVDDLGSKPNGLSQAEITQQLEALQQNINDLQTAQSTLVKQDDLTQLRADLAAITSSRPTTSQQLEELRQDFAQQIGEKAGVSDLTTLSNRVGELEGRVDALEFLQSEQKPDRGNVQQRQSLFTQQPTPLPVPKTAGQDRQVAPSSVSVRSCSNRFRGAVPHHQRQSSCVEGKGNKKELELFDTAKAKINGLFASTGKGTIFERFLEIEEKSKEYSEIISFVSDSFRGNYPNEVRVHSFLVNNLKTVFSVFIQTDWKVATGHVLFFNGPNVDSVISKFGLGECGISKLYEHRKFLKSLDREDVFNRYLTKKRTSLGRGEYYSRI